MLSMGSRYEVIISPSVLVAIDETLDYLINTYSADGAAFKLLSDWKDAVERVSLFPYAMAKVSNHNVSGGQEYRKFFVGNFVTIYYVDEASHVIKLMAFRYAPSKLGDTI